MRGWELTNRQRHEIVAAYILGEKNEVIAARYGCVPSYVTKLAKRRGAKLRKIWGERRENGRGTRA